MISGNLLVMVAPHKRESEKLKKEIVNAFAIGRLRSGTQEALLKQAEEIESDSQQSLTDKDDKQAVKQHYQQLVQQIKQKQQAA